MGTITHLQRTLRNYLTWKIGALQAWLDIRASLIAQAASDEARLDLEQGFLRSAHLLSQLLLVQEKTDDAEQREAAQTVALLFFTLAADATTTTLAARDYTRYAVDLIAWMHGKESLESLEGTPH